MPGSSPGMTDCLLRRLGARAFLRRRDGARRLDLGDLRRAIAEFLGENFLRMLVRAASPASGLVCRASGPLVLDLTESMSKKLIGLLKYFSSTATPWSLDQVASLRSSPKKPSAPT